MFLVVTRISSYFLLDEKDQSVLSEELHQSIQLSSSHVICPCYAFDVLRACHGCTSFSFQTNGLSILFAIVSEKQSFCFIDFSSSFFHCLFSILLISALFYFACFRAILLHYFICFVLFWRLLLLFYNLGVKTFITGLKYFPSL